MDWNEPYDSWDIIREKQIVNFWLELLEWSIWALLGPFWAISSLFHVLVKNCFVTYFLIKHRDSLRWYEHSIRWCDHAGLFFSRRLPHPFIKRSLYHVNCSSEALSICCWHIGSLIRALFWHHELWPWVTLKGQVKVNIEKKGHTFFLYVLKSLIYATCHRKSY